MSPLIAELQVKKAIATVTLDGGDQPVLLPIDTAFLHHLRPGADIPAKEWTEIVAEGQRLLAVRRSLEALSRRHRTERELRTLLARSFDPPAVDHAVERVRTMGYLDDEAWAKRYVASARAAGRGSALLRRELGRLVDDEAALPAVATHDDEAAARAAARKRAPSLRRLEEPLRSRRLYDFLRRRGFPDPVAPRCSPTLMRPPSASPTDR